MKLKKLHLKSSLTLLQKLSLVLLLKLTVGSSILFFIDIIFGSIILIAAVFTFIWIFRLKYSKESSHKILLAQLHIIIGCLMIIGAISIAFSSENFLDIRVGIKSTVAGILLYKGGREFITKKKSQI